MRGLKWILPLALVMAAAATPVALGAAPSPGFSRHTAIDATLNGTATIDSTNATGKTKSTCGSPSGNGHAVWFTWTATTSGSITADTANSNEDTVLFVFENGKLVGCNDDDSAVPCGFGGVCSQVSFDAVEGKKYDFEVGAFDGSAVGTVNLNLSG